MAVKLYQVSIDYIHGGCSELVLQTLDRHMAYDVKDILDTFRKKYPKSKILSTSEESKCKELDEKISAYIGYQLSLAGKHSKKHVVNITESNIVSRSSLGVIPY